MKEVLVKSYEGELVKVLLDKFNIYLKDQELIKK